MSTRPRQPSATAARLAREQDGFTLTELLVAVLAGMVVLLATFALLDSSQSAATRVQNRVEATQNGRVAMELITQRLRAQTCLGTGVPALVDARRDRVSFYTEMRDFSAGGSAAFRPELRRLTFGGDGRVVEEVFAPQTTHVAPGFTFPGYPSSPVRRAEIGRGIQRAGSANFLRYFAFAGSDPATPSLELIPSASGSLSADDRARIVRIVVTYDARPPRASGPSRVDSSFENEVYVRTSDPTDPTHSPQCL